MKKQELNLGPNSGFIESLYELYLIDPSLVGTTWSSYFDQISEDTSHTTANGAAFNGASEQTSFHLGNGIRSLASRGEAPSSASSVDLSRVEAQAKVSRLIDAYRTYGHYQAKISPLVTRGTNFPKQECLTVESYGFGSDDFNLPFFCDDLGGQRMMTLNEIIERLKRIYCGSIGFEWTHIVSEEERGWLQSRIEAETDPLPSASQRLARLKDLVESTLLESELHKRYIGSKRFSLEGGESLIPLLKTIITEGANLGVEQFVFGMAHRGRLNVLVNIMGRPLMDLFLEFDDRTLARAVGAGDVKYHLGFESVVSVGEQNQSVSLALTPNPSHLEFVNPVVAGMVRALQDTVYGEYQVVLGSEEEVRLRQRVCPLLIHGDAAFIGQGVVTETVNLSLVEGYRTGGTVHVVVNNQIGFTATPDETRSTPYCTDMAKTVDAPVFHVNAEDVDAVCRAGQLAMEYRNLFGKDAIIDLYCYRKYGHNEGDDPSYTQPVCSREIKAKKPILDLYAAQLESDGIVSNDELVSIKSSFVHRLDEASSRAQETVIGELCPLFVSPRTRTRPTCVKFEDLREVAKAFQNAPESFKIHPKLEALMNRRLATVEGDKGIDWGTAEALAFGSLLKDGVSVRLSGQDCGRGTFSHRHAVLDNYESESGTFLPLRTLNSKVGFEVVNSVLSEAGVLGFEFGYSSIAERALVLWEAQFGDFVNGAQVCVDQFIASSEEKWDLRSGVVLLLPHGYEGAGPEHSSARLERFLQLCSDGNMDVCVPSSPAQYFHMLRRQVYSSVKRPLIVMTPKSLLRLPEASDSIDKFTQGSFCEVIRRDFGDNPSRLLFMSGKVYYDVLKAFKEREDEISKAGVSLVRIEQLHPFPFATVREIIAKAPDKSLVAWVQEEPKNQGAWGFVEPRFENRLTKEVRYIGRPVSASTATGSSGYHGVEQQRIVSTCISFALG